MAGTWTCTDDEDFGGLTWNRVQVTGGTSGTPTTPADFVTADAAGEAVLLAAVSCAKGMSLTYQIRPTMAIALTISFIIAAKTAHTDYVFITGTDWDDQAQTESIDISAGNETYTTTKKFRTITQIDIEDVGDGNGTAAADGTVRVTQPQWGRIWDYGNGFYKITAKLMIGDGSASTYFTVDGLSIEQTANKVSVTANANMSILSSYWTFQADNGNPYFVTGGTLTVKRSLIQWISTNNFFIIQATLDISDSIICGDGTDQAFIVYEGTGSSGSIENLYLYNLRDFSMRSVNVTMDTINVDTSHSAFGSHSESGQTFSISDAKATNSTYDARVDDTASSCRLNLIDPRFTVSDPYIVSNDSECWLQYTVNIKVVDKNGTAIQTANVVCDTSESSNYDTEEFDVNTDASGDIAEQTITAKKWVDVAKTETDYAPTQFTISKAGYETLILKAITVNAPIVWHLELQPMRARVLGRPSRRISAPNFQ